MELKMDMDAVAQYLADKKSRSLARVRCIGLIAASMLLLAAGWIALRELALQDLPHEVNREILVQEHLGVVLTLKRISLTAYLAKVRSNMLLFDLTRHLGEFPCEGLDDYHSLHEEHPCRRQWKSQITLLWWTAFDGDGPPLGPDILADRWGSPFMLDMSEISCGNYGAWCPEDTVRSPGKDGKLDTADDSVVTIPQHVKRDFTP